MVFSGDEYVEAMTKVDGLIKQLMTLAASSKPKMMVPAIRALGNGLTGDDINTEAMMSAGYLDMASYMLTSEERKPDSVIKDVIWGLSNIAAGTSSQQHRLAASTYILAEVGHQIKGADFKIRKVSLTIRVGHFFVLYDFSKNDRAKLCVENPKFSFWQPPHCLFNS